MIGSRYRHFEIERLLGTGGMGEVYLAVDMNLERRVALKFLPRQLTGDRTAQGRLLDEARSCARLHHPNVVAIHSVEEDGGTFAICMEYVEGRTVRQILAGRCLEIPRILEIALGVARGVAAAHEHGIIHRDLKPANVIITGKGLVKVMDFGLALRPRRTVETTGPESYGTVAYMSPEQARGSDLSPATDIFSFGTLVYEMITGGLPFQGENDLATLHAIISQEIPSLREQRRDLPPGLERLVRACLQKNPADRPATMEEVASTLKRLAGAKSGPTDLISELTTGLQTESMRRRRSRKVSPLPGAAPARPALATRTARGMSPPPGPPPGSGKPLGKTIAGALAALALSFAAIVALQLLVLQPMADKARGTASPPAASPNPPAPAERTGPYEPASQAAGVGGEATVESLEPPPELELPPRTR